MKEECGAAGCSGDECNSILTATLTPSHDCEVVDGTGMFDDQDGVNRNYSGLTVGREEWDASNAMVFYSFVNLGIKGAIPTGSTILSATAEFEVESLSGDVATMVLAFCQVTGSWTETSITYDGWPGTACTDNYYTVAAPTSTGTYQMDWTSHVEDIIQETYSSSYYGTLLYNQTNVYEVRQIDFADKEMNGGATAPSITIEYVGP